MHACMRFIVVALRPTDVARVHFGITGPRKNAMIQSVPKGSMTPKPSSVDNDGTSVRARLARFLERVAALSPLAGGKVAAALLVLRMRSSPERVHTVTYNGRPVLFRTADEMALREVLIDQEYAFLRDWLKPVASPKVIDIGAHIGTFAMWLATAKASAELISVEADPATHRLAERNVAAHLSGARVLHRAGGAADDTVLRLSVEGPSMSHRIAPTGGVEVRSISLTTLVKMAAGAGGRVNLVKIDIEGSEEALLCANPEILRDIDAIVIELHPTLCDTAAVRALLERFFRSVVDIGGRKSAKPLLFCRDNVESDVQ